MKRRRPRLGCVLVTLLAVPALSCCSGIFLSTLPAPEPMPPEAVAPSFDAELQHARGRGFVIVRDERWEHARPEDADELLLDLAASTCVAAIGATWGSQEPARLSIERVEPGARRTVSEHIEPSGLVVAAQWCATEPEHLAVRLERASSDAWSREGHVAGGSRLALLQGPSTTIGGRRGLTRGTIPVETARSLEADSMLAADTGRPTGAALGVPLPIESMAARLIPEDAITYRELHRGAANGSTDEVNPRLTPLPPASPLPWRPGSAHTQAALRAELRPEERLPATHPAVRHTDDGFMRVLAVIDAPRLGVACADIQIVRMLFGHRTVVYRARAGQGALRRLTVHENVAQDHLCASDGLVVYVTPDEDRERHTLRIFSGG
ncbi:MAG: hypothetical protein KC619_30555 [Myxococcales bacterium]|nr:hypothetical protein [Myxococcales bacterium]